MNIQQDLIRHYHWLRQYGYNDSHSGNASVRDHNQFWVTPTGACADLLKVGQLVQCPVDGSPGEGASLDAVLHAMVYRKNPRANALLHSHGAYSVAMTMHGEDFVPPDFEGAYYFDRIPVISIPYEQYLDLAADAVSDALLEHKVVVVRGHGVYATAESINLAYKWTCSFELSAKTCFLAQQAGTLSKRRLTMPKRDKFIAQMKSQLDEGKAELQKLESKAGNARAEIREKSRQAIEELHEKRVVAEMKLKEFEHAGEEAWEDLKEEVERAWTAFKAGMDAFSDFSDHS